MVTPLGKAIEFFRDFGLFDVVLPFLLVFSILFGVLEKTKILGVEGKDRHAKKNLNAMISFVVGLIVVATANVVETINKALPNVILFLIVLLSFLILIGIFQKDEEHALKDKHPYWYGFFVALAFISIVAIFFNAIQAEDGRTWLEVIWDWITTQFDTAVFGSLIILVVVVFAIYYISKGKSESGG